MTTKPTASTWPERVYVTAKEFNYKHRFALFQPDELLETKEYVSADLVAAREQEYEDEVTQVVNNLEKELARLRAREQEIIRATMEAVKELDWARMRESDSINYDLIDPATILKGLK